jgi:DNA-binding response OmpR family regulator
VEQRSVDSMIKRIRKKFREVHPQNEKFDRIKTKYGVGYYWQPLNLYQEAS